MTVQKGRGETVLVVEGDPVLRRLVSEMLAYLGYRALAARELALKVRAVLDARPA